MTIDSANFFSTPGLVEGAAVSIPSDRTRAMSACAWFEPPAAVANFVYRGRVGTFYNMARASYAETYVPARQSAFGPIGRIESRLVRGCWKHAAYGPLGESVLSADEDLVLHDQNSLPLMFAPEEERIFAEQRLMACSGHEVVNLPKDVIVYANRDRSSFGIIRLKFGY